MDTLQQIVHNFAVVVGLNHLRIHSLHHLGEMRFETLRTRVSKVDYKLSRQNVMSLYIMWLQSRAFHVEFSALPITEWCSNLAELLCSEQGVMDTCEDSLHDPQYYHGYLTQKDTELLKKVYNEIRKYYDKKGGKGSQRTGASRCPLRSKTANPPPVDNSSFFKQTTVPAPGKSKSQDLPSKPSGAQEAGLKRPKETACVEPRTSWHSEAPKSLEKGMCRRCRATGHAISDCPTRDDPSWDPPPHPRYICGICGEYGSHYVWDCQFHQSNSSGEQKSRNDEPAGATKPQPVAPADVHLADALRNDVRSSQILSAGKDDDLSRPLSTAKTDPVALPGGADWRDKTLESRFWASIGPERSYQLVSSVREAGRLSPWEEECERGELDGEKRFEKRSRSERDEVAHHKADDFLSRLGKALKRNFGTSATPDGLNSVDYDPIAKRPRLDLEEGEVVDESTLPSLVASVATSDRESKDESSLAEPQSGGSHKVGVSTESVGQLDRCPTAHELSPNQEWEHTTLEARKTAMELWQNGSDSIEPHAKFDKEAQLFAGEIQTGDELIDQSTAIRGQETVVVVGGDVDTKADKEAAPINPPLSEEGCGESGESRQARSGQSLAGKSCEGGDIATWAAKFTRGQDGCNDRAGEEYMETLGCSWLRWFRDVSPETKSREAKGT